MDYSSGDYRNRKKSSAKPIGSEPKSIGGSSGVRQVLGKRINKKLNFDERISEKNSETSQKEQEEGEESKEIELPIAAPEPK